MTDQDTVRAIHPDAQINWTRSFVEVRAGNMILGQTRMLFVTPLPELEAAAWADAAKRIEKGAA